MTFAILRNGNKVMFLLTTPPVEGWHFAQQNDRVVGRHKLKQSIDGVEQYILPIF
jgi:hypothetical protein